MAVKEATDLRLAQASGDGGADAARDGIDGSGVEEEARGVISKTVPPSWAPPLVVVP